MKKIKSVKVTNYDFCTLISVFCIFMSICLLHNNSFIDFLILEREKYYYYYCLLMWIRMMKAERLLSSYVLKQMTNVLESDFNSDHESLFCSTRKPIIHRWLITFHTSFTFETCKCDDKNLCAYKTSQRVTLSPTLSLSGQYN